MSKLFKALAFAGATLAMSWTAAVAGEYPERPVGVAVSYGAGGATDFQARIVTMVAGNEDMLGQPMYIVNKPGAGGRVGWNWFATEAEADGYTLSAYNVPHFIAQSIKGGVDYSTDSFEPIANWGADPAVVIVGKDSEFNTIQEMVEYAAANPGKVTLSGAGLSETSSGSGTYSVDGNQITICDGDECSTSSFSLGSNMITISLSEADDPCVITIQGEKI